MQTFLKDHAVLTLYQNQLKHDHLITEFEPLPKSCYLTN
jgi:hypothetical protein